MEKLVSIYWVIVVVGLLVGGYSWLLFNKEFGLVPFGLWLGSWLLVGLYKKRRAGWRMLSKGMDKKLMYGILVIGGVYLVRLWILITGQDWVYFHNDEGVLSRTALDVFTDGVEQGNWDLLGFFPGTVTYFPALWYYLSGGLTWVFGPNLVSVKLLSLVADLGIAICVLGIMRRWIGWRLGLLSGVIYASLPVVVHFGMTGYQNIQSTLALMVAWWLVEKVYDKEMDVKKQRWLLFTSGVVSGLGMYFYLSSVLIPMLLLPLLMGFVYQVGLSRKLAVAEYLLGFGLASVPFWIVNFAEFNFLTGRSEAILWGGSDWTFWWGQLTATLSGLYFGHANGSGEFYVHFPLIPSVFGLILSVVGLTGAVWKRMRYERLVWMMVATLGMTLVFGGVLTDVPPAPQRLLHVLPVLAMLMTLGIKMIGDGVARFVHPDLRLPVVGLLGVELVVVSWLAFGMQNVPQYRERRAPERDFVWWYQEHGNGLPVLAQVPSHMYDTVYLYSDGGFELVKIEDKKDVSNTLKEYGSFWYLTFREGWDWLGVVQGERIVEVDWEHIDEYRLYGVSKNGVLL